MGDDHLVHINGDLCDREHESQRIERTLKRVADFDRAVDRFRHAQVSEGCYEGCGAGTLVGDDGFLTGARSSLMVHGNR